MRTDAGHGHDDPLTDFERRTCAFEGVSRTVHVAGTGPAVIVMPEMPGISPDVARFARWVREAGFTVWMPSLFGRDGAYPTVAWGEQVMRRACVAEEFRASPVAARARSRVGYGRWPGRPTTNAAVPGWARSACVSRATSR